MTPEEERRLRERAGIGRSDVFQQGPFGLAPSEVERAVAIKRAAQDAVIAERARIAAAVRAEDKSRQHGMSLTAALDFSDEELAEDRGWNQAIETVLAIVEQWPPAGEAGHIVRDPSRTAVTIEELEAEAGRLIETSARARAERMGPTDAHELRHLYAAIMAGNSDPCEGGAACHLDAAQ